MSKGEISRVFERLLEVEFRQNREDTVPVDGKKGSAAPRGGGGTFSPIPALGR